MFTDLHKFSRLPRRASSIGLLLSILFFCYGNAYAGFLYLLNDDSAGSRIYGFSVDETTGALTALPGFPVTPGNGGINSIVSERMAADPANNRLYVINDSSDSVSAYSIDPASGAITPIPFSPIALGTGSWNTIRVHPSGSPMIVTHNASAGGARSFVITQTTATEAAGSPFPLGGPTAFSSSFSHDGNYFYAGGNTGTTIAGFSVNTSDGVLTTLPGSPFPVGASNPVAHAVDAAGRYYVVDTADAIRVFTSTDGALTPVNGNPFISGLTQRRYSQVHPNGNFYFVAGNSGNNVGAYAISGSGAETIVTPVAGSPYPTGATTANVLALNQTGTFLYVGNRISRSVTTFSVNTDTGVLTNLGSQPSNTLGTTGAINGIAYLASGTLVAQADISGRITDSSGTGVGNVTIRLTGGTGPNLAAITNPFGYYRFQAVPTGSTYVLTPLRKMYTFSPPNRVIMHTDEVSDADFTGQQN